MVIVIIFSLALCFIAAWFAVAFHRQAKNSSSWLSTSGKIIRFTIGGDEKCSVNRFYYRYEVDGKCYENYEWNDSLEWDSYVGCLGVFSTEIEAEKSAEKIIGKELIVWFNPENKSESVLCRKYPRALIIFLALSSLICFMLAVVVFLQAARYF